MWDVATGSVKRTLDGQEAGCARLAFSLRGDPVAGSEGALLVWDAATGESVSILADFTDPVYNVWFPPEGDRLCANSGGSEFLVY